MTTTWSTDAQVYARSPLAASALAAVNATLTVGGQATTSLNAYRVEAQRQILIALRPRGITDETQVSRPEDLQEPEICLALALLFEASGQRVNPRQGAQDLFAQNAILWRETYKNALAAAAPVDGVRSVGSSFSWGRG
jgi:hypothetical protein